MNKILLQLVPVMLAFFAMGAVDFVGTATNYIKGDFALSDTVANFLTSMVFIWFLIFAVPTGILMNKLGRRPTVIISLIITALGLTIPLLDYNLPAMLVAFSLIGIGNTVMQVSVNPLLSNIVSPKQMPSAMTFGQFVKSCASLLGPLLAGWGAVYLGSWQILFPFFLVVCIIAGISLAREKITEDELGQPADWRKCMYLLLKLPVLLCFLGIVCHVGIDVGINLSTPKIVMQKLSLPLEQAGLATGVYFLFRTFGSLSGAYILHKFSSYRFFIFSVGTMLVAMVGFGIAENQTVLYICLALLGFGNANIFPIIFARALQNVPTKKNEISGLMIMGLFGGTIFPLIMGIITDLSGTQTANIAVMALGAFYLLRYARQLATD